VKGLFGRLLDVDLTSGACRDYNIPEVWQELLLGARALGARILLSELSGIEAALSPENVLLFMTGPLQGTGVVGSGRHLVMSLSPKTGSVCDSYAGGYFGHELGRSGYDGILIRGASQEPVYLVLLDGVAQILSAEDLWGQGTARTEEILQNRHPRCRVASIGVAGERLVRMSCIIHDRSRAAGRPGLGAVMGSKRLKAVVVRGAQQKVLHDRQRFLKERAAYAKRFRHASFQSFGEYGTPRGIMGLNEMGILPTRNFQEGAFDGAERISGEYMHRTILAARETCAGCPLRCKRAVSTMSCGIEVKPEFGGPEYETIAAFGSLCLNDDLGSIAVANQLCNDLGLDTISAGVAIAFLMEASEKGLLGQDRVAWGDGEAIVSWVRRIAYREGVGDLIADGLDGFAAKLGADFAMTIKGVEVPMHEPRGKKGLAISYATSHRGANHMEGFHDTFVEIENAAPELGVISRYDRFDLSSKPSLVRVYEDLQGFVNCLVLCSFTTRGTGSQYAYPAIRSFLEAATGIGLSAEDMLKVGARGKALLDLLAADAGFSLSRHHLPTRFAEPLKYGASAGQSITPAELAGVVREYYDLRGYDESGPTPEMLSKLGLADCIRRRR